MRFRDGLALAALGLLLSCRHDTSGLDREGCIVACGSNETHCQVACTADECRGKCTEAYKACVVQVCGGADGGPR